MACQGKIVSYYQVRNGARFDVCISGTANGAGTATVVDSDPATPHLNFPDAALRQPCGDDNGAHFHVQAGRVYIVRVEYAAISGGSLKICHSVTTNGTKHQRSCCWDKTVSAGESVVRRVVLLVP